MATIVQKYGGTSVADTDKLRSVADAVVKRAQAGNRLVVVVSAMGKTTDRLIEQARQVTERPSRRELDMLVTSGERISMALLSMAIHESGQQAISFTGSQSGIITDTNHQDARVIDVRPNRILTELDLGKVVIVAGYQGVSREREVTTLGRGGSDTSAVALAEALQADGCEIYSDVDGVYSADPNVCGKARLIPELSYEAMQAMAAAGASVLNADAVRIARRAGIRIIARRAGDVSGRQTTVHDKVVLPEGVTAVVGAKVVTRLMGDKGALEQSLLAMAEVGGQVLGRCEGSSPEVWIDRTGIPESDSAPLHVIAKGHALVAEDRAVVSLIGHGIEGNLGLAQQTLRSASCQALTHIMSAQRLSLMVDSRHCEAGVLALHAALVEQIASR